MTIQAQRVAERQARQAGQKRKVSTQSRRLDFLEWTLGHQWIYDKVTNRIDRFSFRDYLWLEYIYKAIDDYFTDPDQRTIVRRVVIRKGAQLGLTALAINLTFWVIDGQGSVFYALPPGPTAGDFAHSRCDSVISASPRLRKIAGNIDNVGLKTFAGGFNLYIRGTNVPKGDPQRAAQLSEAPADMAIIDEFDRVPPAAVPLIRDRLGDSRLKWELDLSTPVYPDLGIDSEYQNTTQHEPQIQCSTCGEWHWLDWKLVRGPVADDPHARLMCPICGEIIERAGMWLAGSQGKLAGSQGRLTDSPGELAGPQGEGQERARWVARHPERKVLGFWIPKLVSERADLGEGWEQSQARRDVEVQAFWNGWMGLPYEPKGARLTRELIAACVAPDEIYPAFPARATWTAMGVDVGLELHYWIKERRPDGRERAVAIGSVMDWSDLDTLMLRYGVQRCVVDDRPELREDKAFQKRHRGKVWLGLEVDSPDADMARWDKKRGVVVIERTKGLAEASAKIELCIDELPADWEMIPDLVEHLTVSIKAKRVRNDGSTVYHFPQTGKADHLHHAKLFCEVALSVLPPDPGQVEDEGGGEETPAAGEGQYYMPGSMRGRL